MYADFPLSNRRESFPLYVYIYVYIYISVLPGQILTSLGQTKSSIYEQAKSQRFVGPWSHYHDWSNTVGLLYDEIVDSISSKR